MRLSSEWTKPTIEGERIPAAERPDDARRPCWIELDASGSLPETIARARARAAIG